MESLQLPSKGNCRPQSPNRESTSAKGKHKNTQRASLATTAELDEHGQMFYSILLTPRTTLVRSDELRRNRLANDIDRLFPTNGQQPQTSRDTPTASNGFHPSMEKESQGQGITTSNLTGYSASNLVTNLNGRNAAKSFDSNNLTDRQAALLKLLATKPTQPSEEPEPIPLKQPICEAMDANKPMKPRGSKEPKMQSSKQEVDEPVSKNGLSISNQYTLQNGSLNNYRPSPNIKMAYRNNGGLSTLAEAAVSRLEVKTALKGKKAEIFLGNSKTDTHSLPGAMGVVLPSSTGGTETIFPQHNEATQDSAPKGLDKDEVQPTSPTREHVESVIVKNMASTKSVLPQTNNLYEPMPTCEPNSSNNGIQAPLAVDRSEKDTLPGPEQDAEIDESVGGKGTCLTKHSKKRVYLKAKTKEKEEEVEEAIATVESKKKDKKNKKREREKKKAREQWENKKRAEQAKKELKEAKRREQEKLENERLERERLERENLKQEKLKQEKLERERLEQERLEQERLGREKMEREKMEREKSELRKLEETKKAQIQDGIHMAEQPGGDKTQESRVKGKHYPVTQREQGQVSRGETSHSETQVGGKDEKPGDTRQCLPKVKKRQENKPLESYLGDGEINLSSAHKVNHEAKLPDREGNVEPTSTTPYVTNKSKPGHQEEETAEVIIERHPKSRTDVDDAKSLPNDAHNQLKHQQKSDSQPPEAPQTSSALLNLLRGTISEGEVKQAPPGATTNQPFQANTQRQYFEAQYPQPPLPEYYYGPMQMNRNGGNA
ncbi:hypothetical protein F4814DRAFT_445031 [Daldinia grandis]|nr:hypothetical protein F4814DRAFT_445031 [Daldinia grandis]